MDRISEFHRIITGTKTEPLTGTHPLDATLLHIIVHLAFADGEVDEAEFDRLALLMPGLESGQILERVVALSDQMLDIGNLEIEVAAPTDRRRLLQLAEELVELDGTVTVGEHRLLSALRQEIG
ncbi:MAG: hypothetical protein ACI8PZ_003564 [Myxococcota bacterium]|jgi:hypothetical protein